MKILPIASALTMSLMLAAPVSAGGVTCIQSFLVDHTHVVNTSTVDFYMRDDKVWRSNLIASCPGLNFNGFTVIGHDSEICSPVGITILQTHQVCQLGSFTQVPNASTAAH